MTKERQDLLKALALAIEAAPGKEQDDLKSAIEAYAAKFPSSFFKNRSELATDLLDTISEASCAYPGMDPNPSGEVPA